MLGKKPTTKLTNPKKIYKHERVDCAIASNKGAFEVTTRIEDVLKSGIRLFVSGAQPGQLMKGQRISVRYYRSDGKYQFLSEIKTVVPVSSQFLLEIALPTKLKKL